MPRSDVALEDEASEIGELLDRYGVLELAREVLRLHSDCAQAYQAVGFLADCMGYWDMAADNSRHRQITKLLDNLSAASNGEARMHTDLIPFGWQT